MRIRFAKRNPVVGTLTVYVPSESNPREKYNVQLVTRDGKTTGFCPCGDFINRRLPHLGTNTFSHCKHGKRALKAARAAGRIA